MTDLPQSFYKERVPEAKRLRSGAFVAALLALLSGWVCLGLPGAPLHLLRLPEDVPDFGVGIANLNVSPDGHWLIQRQHYADRMNRYEVDPDGTLHKYRGALRDTGKLEMQGLNPYETAEDIIMPGGHTIKVRPSRQYYEDRRDWRAGHLEKQRKAPQQPIEPPSVDRQAIMAEQAATGFKEPYVVVMTYLSDVEARFILAGHTYYEVLDDAYFHHPNLWITTDQLGWLHRCLATDVGGKVRIEVQKSIKLDLPVHPQFDSKLGIDHSKGLLYLLLPTGDRYWFDPQSLERKGHDKLPGEWEREYAIVGFVPATKDYPGYPEGSGWGLTEHGYNNVMLGLRLTFIASLVWLALELLLTWKSTSARTTAATS